MTTEVTTESATTEESTSATTSSTSSLAESGSPPVVLGQGYNTFLGTGKDLAVTISQPANTSSGSELECTICVDQTTLTESLRLSASAAATYGLVGVDAKTEFSQSLEFSSTSVAVVVYSSSIKSTQTALGVNLKKKLVPADDDASVDSFVKKYGDSYVNQIVTGGEYVAVYLFHAESVEQQTSISGQISTELKGKTSSFNAELQASLDTICTEVQARQDFRELTLGTTARRGTKSVVEFAASFGDAGAGEGLDDDGLAILSYTVDVYENLTTMPAAFDAVIANRKLYDYGADGQSGLGNQYAELCAIRSTIENIQDTYDAYGYTGDDVLTSRQAVIEADIATLETLFRDLSTYPTTVQTAPSLQGLSWGTPSLNYQFDSAGVYGSLSGGKPFQDVTADSIPLRKVLTKFNAWGDAVVDKIACTYSDVSTGGGETTYTHGGLNDNGKSKEAGTLTLAAGERVMLVWGTYNDAVYQINIATGNSQTFKCPQSPEHAAGSYSWGQSGTTFFVGFNGRDSEDDINQLDIKVVKFGKATWK